MPVFDFKFQVQAPVEVVSAFHFEPGILRTLSPPFTYLQVHNFEPLAEGSIAEFTMWLGPLPVYWKARHSEVSSSGFCDTQVDGPMKYWKHRHSFNEIDADTTEVHEHIEFEHYSGLRGLQSRLLFPKPALWSLFAVRRWKTRRVIARRMDCSFC